MSKNRGNKNNGQCQNQAQQNGQIQTQNNRQSQGGFTLMTIGAVGAGTLLTCGTIAMCKKHTDTNNSGSTNQDQQTPKRLDSTKVTAAMHKWVDAIDAILAFVNSIYGCLSSNGGEN